MRLIWHFIILFTLTILIGLTVIIIASRGGAERVANNVPPGAKLSKPSTSSATALATRDKPESEAPEIESPESKVMALAANRPAASNPSFSSSAAKAPDSAVRQNEVGGRALATPSQTSSSTGGSSSMRPSLTVAETGAFSTTPRQLPPSDTSASSEFVSSEPDNNPGVYPPRRIPWHQGWTVEEQWYRAWYGWTALDTETADALQQSH